MTIQKMSQTIDTFKKKEFTKDRKGNGVSEDFLIEEEIGKGSNNRVYRGVYKNGDIVAIRFPRRKSDTENYENAKYEFLYTLLASNLNVAPDLYDAWYVKHKTNDKRAGLHFVSKYYDLDVQSAIEQERYMIADAVIDIEEQVNQKLVTLANNYLLTFDLKPSNMVYDFDNNDLRFIDFGREFCERNTFTQEDGKEFSVTNFIKEISKNNTDENEGDELYRELLFGVMLVQLAANVTFYLHSSRHVLNLSKYERDVLNFTKSSTSSFLKNKRGRFIKLLKQILRNEDIKKVNRHYLGRRNSGTQRVLKLASGIER